MRVNKTIRVFLSIVMLFSITVGISFSTYANESDTSGSCGKNVQWKYADGTLTISGTGDMEAYSNTRSLPWYNYINEITRLEIIDGVKTIASFRSLEHIKEINIPNSVYEINADTFIGCYSLEKVNLSNNLQFLGTEAFSGCPMLQSFTIDNSLNGKTKDILGLFGDITGYFFVRDGVLFSFSDTYYKEDLSKVSIEHIRLEKYPSGRENDTYIIPQDTLVVARDAFTSLMHLNNIIVPASVRSFNYFSICGDLRDSDKPLNIIFQHNAYPTDMCYRAFFNFPKNSKIIVKNNTVKNEFINKKEYYNADVSNGSNLSVITENTPCQSVSVDKADVKIKIGESVTVVPTQSPTITTDNVSFTSSNKKIAFVDEYNFGNITGVSPGKATITVTSGNVKAIVNVEVVCEHLHKKTVNAKVASCSAEGYSGDKICSDCGAILEKGTSTPKKAHTYKTYTTRATTSAAGKITTKCSVCGAVKSTQTIARISSVKLSGTSYIYNGKTKTPSVVVKNVNGKILVKNTDYTVTYPSGRKYVGKYAVKVTFKGKYSGTKTLYFTIKPKSTSISSLKAGSKKFTVKWYKRTTQTTGYQVQYSTSSKFSSPKTVTISKTGTTSKTISKLKAKKKYYVRVRTYKTVNGKKYYSSWSKARYVTTKS